MKKNCPNYSCQLFNSNASIVKVGSFFRKCDSKYIQRFHCKQCKKNFSHATGKDSFRFRKRRELPLIRKLYCSGVSMRRIAKVLKLHRKTVNRKIYYLSILAEKNIEEFRKELMQNPAKNIQFDDLITIEHTKLKPLSVSIAVDKDTRKFLGVEVSQIPSFGLLAERSVKKYGYRKSSHKKALIKLFNQLKSIVNPNAILNQMSIRHIQKW